MSMYCRARHTWWWGH